MGSKNIFESYDRHAMHEKKQAEGLFPSCFIAPDSVDAWRHRRMHDTLEPLIKTDPDSAWLTVGDGSYGSDAYYLQQQGVDVLASSLTDHALKIAAEKGYLKKYAAVNAEKIPYEDESFDYVLCKEAYHHFPRPPVAFYEMMRVARKGVVLIEPYDGPRRLLDMIKEPAKKLLWGRNQTIHFEPSGNYIYRVSPKEMGKMLAAMGCAAMAYKTFNDIYLPQFGKSSSNSSFGYIATRMAILLQNILCMFRLLNPGLLVLVCFKDMPDNITMREMKYANMEFKVLPANPYVDHKLSDPE